MDLSSQTIRDILAEITREPARVNHWQSLLMACFDQRDSENFQSLQVAVSGLEQLWAKEENRIRYGGGAGGLGGLGGLGSGSSRKKLTDLPLRHEQRDMLIRFSKDPSNPVNLADVAKMYLKDFDLGDVAARHVERALFFEPGNPDLTALLEDCHNHTSVADAPLEEPSLPEPDVEEEDDSLIDLSSLVRKTSRIKPDREARKTTPIPGLQENGGGAGEAAGAQGPGGEGGHGVGGALPGIPMAGGGSASSQPLHGVPVPFIPVQPGGAGLVGGGFAGSAPVSQSHLIDPFSEEAENVELTPELAEAWHRRALISIEEGKLKRAIEECERAQKIDPTCDLLWNAWDLIGAGYLQVDKPEAALKPLEQAIERKPDFAPAWFHIGMARYDGEDVQGAMEAYEVVLELEPRHTDALANMGSILIEQHKPEEAIEWLRSSVEASPANARAWDNLAAAYTELGRQDEARGACLNALRTSPDMVEARFKLGLLDYEQKNWFEALHSFEMACEARPDFSISTCYHAMTLAKLGRPDEALEECDSVYESDPGCELIWHVLYEVKSAFQEHHRYDEAEQVAHQMAETAPQNVRSWLYLAASQESAGDWKGAVASYQKATEVSSESVKAWHGMGLALYRLRKYAAAEEALQKASRFSGSDATIFYHHGVCLEKLQRGEDALEAYERCVALDPEMVPAWNNIGSIGMLHGYHELALDALSTAVKLRPDYAKAWYNLSLGYESAGDVVAAVETMKKAVDLQPDYTDAWHKLTELYRGSRMEKEAGEALMRSVSKGESGKHQKS